LANYTLGPGVDDGLFNGASSGIVPRKHHAALQQNSIVKRGKIDTYNSKEKLSFGDTAVAEKEGSVGAKKQTENPIQIKVVSENAEWPRKASEPTKRARREYVLIARGRHVGRREDRGY